jgi:hypothetical protein
MSALAGRGHGDHPVFARAVLLQGSGGRPTLPLEVTEEAARRLRRREAPLDIVLVAPDAASALLLRLPPGLSVAGVVAERGDVPALLPEDVCLVAGVAGASAEIPEGEWVLLDPRRGRVIVGPDASEIARLQAGPDRPRVLLGAAHMPAQTQSGVEVSVWAVTRTQEELAAAMVTGGADGVVVPCPSDFLPPDAPPSEAQARLLFRIAGTAGGGPVGLYAAPADLDLATVVSLAARCQAHWLLRPGDLPVPVAELRAELVALVSEEEETNPFAIAPRLVAVLPAPLETDDLTDYDELLVICDSAESIPAAGALARGAGLPLRAWLGENLEEDLASALREGVAGIIVAPEQVEAAKYRIRAEG